MPRQLRLLDDRLPTVLEPDRDPLVVRESRRARRLFLQLVPPHTLELVVPVGTRPKIVEAFVREHSEWITRARTQVEARYSGDRALLPARVSLPAVGKTIEVRYRRAAAHRPHSRTMDGVLELQTIREDHLDGRLLLRRWLLEEARVHLKPWLLREAKVVGRAPRKVQVRLQRTRWGSCSGHGNISLNASALFLEAPVVRYLMIHELCHLYSLNHSRRFWRLVERYEPDWRVLDRRLANAWTEIPLWVAAG